eukprot:m.141348 g.141348  ORF g.141348 m.141348 type:complete len:350 (+) comp13194_c5_seq10:240-1289(+)
MFAPKFNAVKLKTNLKVVIKRLQLLEKKHDNSSILARKEIANMLRENRLEIAKIKVEQIIRDDFYREALEILETYCTLCLTRFGLIQTVQHCEVGVRKAVCTILWATPRISVDVREFQELSRQFTLRYGKEFQAACMSEEGGDVCERVQKKLNFVMPDGLMVHGYLEAIARKYKVDIELEKPEVMLPMDTPNPQLNTAVLTPEQRKQQEYNSNRRANEDMLSGLEFPSPVGIDNNPNFAHPPSSMSTANNYPPQQQQQQSYPPQQQQQNYPPQQQQQHQNYPPQQPPSYPGNDTVDPFVGFDNVPQQPPSDNVFADLSQLPTVPGVTTNNDASLDFDDLSRRFDALHRD